MMRLSSLFLALFLAVGCGGDGNKGSGEPLLDLGWEKDVPSEEDGLSDLSRPDEDRAEQPDTTVVPDTVQPGSNDFYPSAELGIRIMSPSSAAWVGVAGGAISVRGVVMGKVKSVSWSSDSGGSGAAVGTPYFNSGMVTLSQGDNLVTVTATDGVQTVSDSIHITYSPGFGFGRLRVIPGGMFVGQKTMLRFAQAMDSFGNFKPETLVLCECTETGMCLGGQFALTDDGDTATSGDEVQGDAVYSAKREFTKNQPGKLCFRAMTQVAAAQPYTAASAVVCIEVLEHFTSAQCEASKNVLKEAKTRYQAGLAQGTGIAVASGLEYLQTAPGVAQAGSSPGGHGLWVRFQNGVLGAVDASPAGTRGGGEANTGELESAELGEIDPLEVTIQSRRSVAIAPYKSEFGVMDEAQYIAGILDASSCAPYRVDGPYVDTGASLRVFRALADYGIVAISSHGDAYFRDLDLATKVSFGWRHMGSQELIWSGDVVDCTQLFQGSQTCAAAGDCPKGTECVITEFSTDGLTGMGVSGICVDHKQMDLRRGNLVLGADRYGVLPSHIEEYAGDGFPKSLVYLGTCRSLWNGTMALSFTASGAQTVLGYTGYVTSEFAYQQGREALAEMLQEKKLAGAAMPGQNIQDPANAGTYLGLFGMDALNIYNPEIINPSFETGDLMGWFKEGDGRVVTQLGSTQPAEGKFMSLISTGLGYTQQTGTIEQDFCIPAEVETARIYWKLFSEEFQEFCGSEYMDSFEAVLESEAGNVTLVDTWIDALCPAEACFGCGAQYVGMVESDVSFDQDDVWNIEWQTASKDVRALAGKGPVTLRFFTGDVGDSIYDTAVLVDSVVFE